MQVDSYLRSDRQALAAAKSADKTARPKIPIPVRQKVNRLNHLTRPRLVWMLREYEWDAFAKNT